MVGENLLSENPLIESAYRVKNWLSAVLFSFVFSRILPENNFTEGDEID